MGPPKLSAWTVLLSMWNRYAHAGAADVWGLSRMLRNA